MLTTITWAIVICAILIIAVYDFWLWLKHGAENTISKRDSYTVHSDSCSKARGVLMLSARSEQQPLTRYDVGRPV